MIHLYLARNSVVHRLRAGTKLLVLALAALALSILPQNAWTIAVALGSVIVLHLLARLPLALLGAELRRMSWFIAAMAVALLIFIGPLTAWVNTGRVVTIVLLASLLTRTTRMGDLLDVLGRLLAPARRFGVDVDAVRMTVALTITMIPVVAGFGHDVRDAEHARGVRIGVRGVVPLMIRTLRHADDVGDALAARGLG